MIPDSEPQISSEVVPDAPIDPQSPTLDRLKVRLTASLTRAAPYVVAVDGVLVMLTGLYALANSFFAFQGEGLILLIAGFALLLFGFLMIVRWNLPLVRLGLVGLTAGYFAEALQEFQVATDPCDIGATMERCLGHVPGGVPWQVYQGPMMLATFTFVLIAFQPLLHSSADA